MEKLIKKILHEVVGVPKGIELSAKELYNDIIQYLEQNPEFITNGEEFELPDAQKYRFSDYVSDVINVKISHIQNDSVDQYLLVGMGVGQGSERSGVMIKFHSNTIGIVIKVVRPEHDINSDKVMTLLKSDNASYITSLAHELKHAYDNFKNSKGENIEYIAKYQTFSNGNFGNEVLNRFIYNTYYSSKTESLVRPVEIYTWATEKGVTKKDFKNFLIESRIYKTLQNIVNTSYEDFRGQLKENMAFINEVIVRFKGEKIPNDDEGKIDLFLKGLYITLGNLKMKNFKELLMGTNPLLILGLNYDNDEKILQDFQKKLRAFKGRELEYFKNTIKENQYQATKAIKKLGKVYSILPDEIETEKIDENFRKIVRFDPTNFEMSQLINRVVNIIKYK